MHEIQCTLKSSLRAQFRKQFSSKKLFITQRRGILTLVPKGGDQKSLKNKRPICLLDTIYKIIAKVLAIRLSRVIDSLVSHDQSGFIKGRNIQDNLRTIQDAIDYSEKENIPTSTSKVS